MAEFCLKCWNEINETNDPSSKYIISKDLELCEGCGKLTHVVLLERKYYYHDRFRFIIVPCKIAFAIFLLLCKMLRLPYQFYKRIRAKGKDHKQ